MSKMTSQQVAENLFTSVDIIVNRRLSQAGFDRTIPVIIVSCIDQASGTYKVQYQDAVYTATATTTDVVYQPGDEVYIIIPEGDMSNGKKIIGTVATAAVTNNLKETDSLTNYRDIGESVTDSKGNEFGLCSYRWYNQEVAEHDRMYLYEGVNTNDFSVDNESFAAILQEEGCDYIGIAATFRTELKESQKGNGNYGIIVQMLFEDESGEEHYYDFPLDINRMEGSPYSFSQPSPQKIMYNVPNGTFKRIESVLFFTEGFINKSLADNLINDIFVKDIKVTGMAKTDAPYFSTYTMELHFSKGTTLSSTNTETVVTPEMYYHGELVTDTSFDYYWFRENSNIVGDDDSYYAAGGIGWECLNGYTEKTTEDDEILREWNVHKTYEIKRGSVFIPQQVKYKCIAQSNAIKIEKVFYINDSDPTHSVLLTADKQVFTNSNGAATMTCDVNWMGENLADTMSYSWHKIDAVGIPQRIKSIDENGITSEGNVLSNVVSNYEITVCLHGLIDLIELGFSQGSCSENDLFMNGSEAFLNALNPLISKPAFTDFLKDSLTTLLKVEDIQEATYKEVLAQMKVFDERYYITYLYDNKYYELPAAAFSSSVHYSCTAYAFDAEGNQFYLGSSSITLTNTVDSTSNATLNIIGGEQIFKYDEEGRSPCSTINNQHPQVITPLTFTLFDENGVQINDAKIFDGAGSVVSDWYWRVPIENTFIELDNTLVEESEQEDGYYIIRKIKELPFEIKSVFSDYCNQNKIHLVVVYQDKFVRASTNFMFLKDGLSGSNGTEYVCKVSPNIDGGIEEYPSLTFDAYNNGYSYLNYSPKEYNKWFKAELWRNGELITQGADGQLSTEWKLLSHNYIDENGNKISTHTESHYAILHNIDGTCENTNFYESTKEPSLITQAKMTYTASSTTTESGETEVNNNIVNRTQTIYGAIPLTTIIRYLNNYILRIKPSSGFNYVLFDGDGRNPAYANREFEVEIFHVDDLNTNIANLFVDEIKFETYGHSQLLFVTQGASGSVACTVRVSEGYSGYETNNGLKCIVGDLGIIYHPIHMMLNRYGISALNGWNGNSMEVNDQGTVLLAPQIGAGYKETDNSFTGIVMGTMREDVTQSSVNGFKDRTGLFGFKAGAQSIFLDAETGKAEFGSPGEGQIIINPGSFDEETGELVNSNAMIYGGNYVEKNLTQDKEGSGLLINLTKPEIRYGTEKFIVDEEGNLFASNATIKGDIIANSLTIIPNGEQEEEGIPFDEYINNLETSIKSDLQAQIVDKVIETWYQSKDPRKNDDWGEDSRHVGDLWYNPDTNEQKRLTEQENGMYEWESYSIPNEFIDKIDGKATIYDDPSVISQSAQGQQVNDLLIPSKNYIYKHNEDSFYFKMGCVYKCIIGYKEDNDDTNDNTMEKFTAFIYEKDANGQEQMIPCWEEVIYGVEIDNKIETWYQSENPALEWTDDITIKSHKGDLWHYTGEVNITIEKVSYSPNSEFVWQEIEGEEGKKYYQWCPMDVPDVLWDTLDGKATVYTSILAIKEAFSSTAPPQLDDLYMPAQSEQGFEKGKIYRYFPSAFTYSVDDIENATYNFVLNDNGYYESTNQDVHNSYAICRVNLNVIEECDITFNVINYAEGIYDYGVFGKLDTILPLDYQQDRDEVVHQTMSGSSKPDVQLVTYEKVSIGSHYIDIKFRKDVNTSSNNDSLQFQIKSTKKATLDTIFKPESWINTEVGERAVDSFKNKILKVLGVGTPEISEDSVIAPKIGGGYLHITSQDGNHTVIIDPEGIDENNNKENPYIFQVMSTSNEEDENGNKKITGLIGLDKEGNATFSGNITASTFSQSSSVKGNFNIDEDGNISATSLVVNQLDCKEILSQRYPGVLTKNIYVYIDSTSSEEDEWEYEDFDSENSKLICFSSVQSFLDRIPRNLNGHTIYIELTTDLTENITFQGFSGGGRIIFYLGGCTLSGYVQSKYNGVRVDIYGGVKGNATDTNGLVKPQKGVTIGEHTCAIVNNGSFPMYLNYVSVYGPTSLNSGDIGSCGIASQHNGFIYASNIGINKMRCGFRASAGGRIHVNSARGKCVEYRTSKGQYEGYGYVAIYGGIITLNPSGDYRGERYEDGAVNHCSGYTSNTFAGNGGILNTGKILDNVQTPGSPNHSSSPQTTTDSSDSEDSGEKEKVTKTITFTSDYGNSVQGDNSKSWRSDKTPKVGDYGYGDHIAFWFFGNDFNKIKSKDITKVQITFTRKSGGVSSAVKHNFYVHDHTSQPSTTNPGYNSSAIAAGIELATGKSKTFTITNSTIINRIKNSKGICSIPPSQTSTYYSVMSGTMKVKFTYQEVED